MENRRKTRAFGIISQAQAIRQVEAHTFKVRSQSGNGQYVVTNGEGKFECTCPDFQYRVKEGKVEACKHVLAVQFYEKLRQRQDDADTISLAQELALSCKFCGSSSLVKRGKRQTKLGVKAQYECKACGRWFVHNGTHLPRARVDERLQGMAVDLYFSGFSVRKIKRFLEEYYHVRVSHVAVYKWLHKYGRLLAEYTGRFKPRQSGVWNADEMMVKLAHQPEIRQGPKRVNGPWFYLWNIMDNQTRFLLTSRFSFNRNYIEASEAFKHARSVTKEAPSVVVTDGLRSYVGAYAETIPEIRKIVHLSGSSLQSGRNARVERLHGTVREREKVMRSLKRKEKAQELLDAYRAWYNYIRPHMGLGGLTPAQAAEIPLELGRNKMLNLIRKARDEKN